MKTRLYPKSKPISGVTSDLPSSFFTVLLKIAGSESMLLIFLKEYWKKISEKDKVKQNSPVYFVLPLDHPIEVVDIIFTHLYLAEIFAQICSFHENLSKFPILKK